MKPLRVAVAGATGVVGRHAVSRLCEQGYHVRGLCRSQREADLLRRLGATPVVGDLLDPASLGALVAAADVVVHLATAIPRRPSPDSDWTMNDRIRREGTRHLLDVAATAGVRRWVQQGITLVHGHVPDDRIIDEDEAYRPDRITQSAVDMEALVRSAPFEWTILRGGLLYGPGTGREQAWLDALRSPHYRTPGDGSSRRSLVHVVDLARAVHWSVECAPPQSVYFVVDDVPVTVAELDAHVALLADRAPPPCGGEADLPSLACRNARLRAAGWTPVFPSYRSGLAGVA